MNLVKRYKQPLVTYVLDERDVADSFAIVYVSYRGLSRLFRRKHKDKFFVCKIQRNFRDMDRVIVYVPIGVPARFEYPDAVQVPPGHCHQKPQNWDQYLKYRVEAIWEAL